MKSLRLDKLDHRFIKRFLQRESSGGILLVLTSVIAIILANSPLEHWYTAFLHAPIVVQVGPLAIDKYVLLWVNDGLMAIFFLIVGLELKREFLEGELSDPRNIVLPGLGAVGGMLIPALIYVLFNWHSDVALRGWAIPAATDIAFALGVLSLLGSLVPTSLKIFLTSLAIFDDVGAILIIAIFYTENISMTALWCALACLLPLFEFNRRGVGNKRFYVVIGIVMWIAVLKSGIHATLTGVVLAMFVPIKSKDQPEFSPLRSFERDLHGFVAFIILPVFAFCNAGVNLSGVGFDQLSHSIPLGVALGLFVGKQLGVFSICYWGVRAGYAQLPQGVSMLSLYGASVLCGIGFTMSLFIGALAFEGVVAESAFDERLGIILGSLASGVLGFFLLNYSLRRKT